MEYTLPFEFEIMGTFIAGHFTFDQHRTILYFDLPSGPTVEMPLACDTFLKPFLIDSDSMLKEMVRRHLLSKETADQIDEHLAAEDDDGRYSKADLEERGAWSS